MNEVDLLADIAQHLYWLRVQVSGLAMGILGILIFKWSNKDRGL
jgi:hypothetical protein